LQAPLERGDSYVTIWDVRNNFEPILSNCVYNSQCGYINYNNKETLAIGCGDGCLVWANARDLSVFKVEEKHGFCIKTMKFKNNKLITGSPDFRLIINDIPSSGLFFPLIKYMLYLSFIVLITAYFLSKR
jgi:hypothetical protein